MQKQKSRKPRVRRKLVNGEWYHDVGRDGGRVVEVLQRAGGK